METEENKIHELIKLSAEGNTIAFREIVKLYRKYIYMISFKILADEDDTKDVVQDTFINVWKHISEYNPKIKFSTWIYKIAVNRCYDKLKARKRKNNIIIRECELINENITYGFEEKNYSNLELANIIERISCELPEKQRIVFSLRDLNGFSIEEVSELTNMSVSSVKTNLVYARRSIKDKLEKNYDVKDWK